MPEKAKLNYKRAPVSATAQDAGAGPRGKSAGTQSDRMMKKVSVTRLWHCRRWSETPVDGPAAVSLEASWSPRPTLSLASQKHAAMALQLGDIGKRRKQSGKAAKVSVEGRGMAVG